VSFTEFRHVLGRFGKPIAGKATGADYPDVRAELNLTLGTNSHSVYGFRFFRTEIALAPGVVH
jgi:hypothetical protein